MTHDGDQVATHAWRHLVEDDDSGNRVAMYGVMQWNMGNEPGHTLVLVDQSGIVRWIGDYGAPDHGGLMYVPPTTLKWANWGIGRPILNWLGGRRESVRALLLGARPSLTPSRLI